MWNSLRTGRIDIFVEDDPEDHEKEDESDVSEERSIDVAGGDSVDALLKVNTANEVSSQQLPQLHSVIIDNSFNNRYEISAPLWNTHLPHEAILFKSISESIPIISRWKFTSFAYR